MGGVYATVRESRMKTLFYEDSLLPPLGVAIFLAGPTRNSDRTPWRADALKILEHKGFGGTVLIPEYRNPLAGVASPFATNLLAAIVAVPQRFLPRPRIPWVEEPSYDRLAWETEAMERAHVTLFWMPFTPPIALYPDPLPGLTTRSEVGAAILDTDAAVRTRYIALGMPPTAHGCAYIRFHAHFAGLHPIHETLEDTVTEAIKMAKELT